MINMSGEKTLIVFIMNRAGNKLRSHNGSAIRHTGGFRPVLPMIIFRKEDL